MSVTVLISRPLPLPPILVDGNPVEVAPLKDFDKIPGTARVLCSTALDKIDAELIDRLPQSVGLIANLGVGYDNIDLHAAKSRNMRVSNTPVVTEDTADLAFALLLATARKVNFNEKYVRSGQWQSQGASSILGTRVNGKTLGLVGFGDIGQAVARRAAGFGMNILYWNRSAKPEAEAATGAKRVDQLSELLAQSDFISLHTPLTDQTRHLIGTNELNQCKSGAVILNTSRGPVIDESALARALKAGTIAAAGLDVFENEPEITPELLELDQVVLLPHIGSATHECRMDIVMRGISNIVSYLETGKVIDPVL